MKSGIGTNKCYKLTWYHHANVFRRIHNNIWNLHGPGGVGNFPKKTPQCFSARMYLWGIYVYCLRSCLCMISYLSEIQLS